MTEFNLSEKIKYTVFLDEGKASAVFTSDVKEFIRLLKKRIEEKKIYHQRFKNNSVQFEYINLLRYIDTLAGKELTE